MQNFAEDVRQSNILNPIKVTINIILIQRNANLLNIVGLLNIKINLKFNFHQIPTLLNLIL